MKVPSLADRCRAHAEKMQGEGWYTTANILFAAAEALEPPVTPESLKAWRQRLNLTQTEAAKSLGVSLRAYQNYEGGERTITKTLALACAAVAYGLPEPR